MSLKWRFGQDLSYFGMGNYPIPDFIGRDVAVDIGSNMGAFLVKNNKSFHNMYFLEACYENFEQIQRNLIKHNVENCYGFNLAVGKESGKIVKLKSWHLTGGSSCGSSATVEHEVWENSDYHPVMTVDLEGVFELFSLDTIDYMKIDCEGSEYDFLMDKDLSNIDCIGMELHFFIDHKKLVEHIKKYHDVFHGDPKINGTYNRDIVFVNKRFGKGK